MQQLCVCVYRTHIKFLRCFYDEILITCTFCMDLCSPLQCLYLCQCKEHGSVHLGLGLCQLQSGSTFFCLVLSVIGLVYDVAEGLDYTSLGENAKTAGPHQGTP